MNFEKAQEIRRAYWAREFKQVELAKRYGVPQGHISKIISGKLFKKAKA